MGNNIKNIQSPREIKELIRRNQRAGLQRPKRSMTEPENYSSFLEWYVFNNLNISSQLFVSNLQTQYYAEQNFRDRRQRNIEFVRGRHFNEMVYDSEIKQYVTQWVYNQRRNIPPLTYNVVSKLVRSLEGQFRGINTGNIVVCDSKEDRGVELATQLTRCVDRIKDRNRSKTKDAANFKEMLISGQPVCKILWENENINEKTDIKYRNINRALFGVNPGITDYDMDNLRVAYEVHNASLNDIVGAFAKGDYDKGVEIRNMYQKYQGNEAMQSAYTSQSFDGMQIRNTTFNHQGVNNSSYRYFEVWIEISDYEAITEDPLDFPGTRNCHKWRNVDEVKKETDAENENRLQLSEGADPDTWMITFNTEWTPRWYVIYLTPWGKTLDVRESPFKNGKHPFVMTPPDINGEIWGIVEEVLNAQLSMDRQIRQADKIIDNASKGVWLVPDIAIPDTHTNKQYLQELRAADGAVIYKVKDGFEDIVPKQVYANSANVSGNVQEMIHLYAGLVDEISGNYGAVQGRNGSEVSKTAAGYALETQNAGLNVSGIMETYLTMLVDRDDKILKLILEGYTKADFKRITGEEIDPNEFRNYDFSIQQSKGTNSPAYRMQLEMELLQLVRDQLLPFEVFMDISNNPIMIQAKQKLDEYNKKKAIEQQNQPAMPGLQQPAQLVQPAQQPQLNPAITGQNV